MKTMKEIVAKVQSGFDHCGALLVLGYRGSGILEASRQVLPGSRTFLVCAVSPGDLASLCKGHDAYVFDLTCWDSIRPDVKGELRQFLMTCQVPVIATCSDGDPSDFLADLIHDVVRIEETK